MPFTFSYLNKRAKQLGEIYDFAQAIEKFFRC